jgi:hypothetical protein
VPSARSEFIYSDDGARRRAAISGFAGDLSQIRAATGQKPARAGCRLGDGPFGFQAGAAMRKDLAAAAAIPNMRGIEGP